MLRRGLAGLIFTLAICGIVLAEESRGTIVKIENDSITIRPFAGFGKGGKDKEKAEDKTFKFSKDVKVVRVGGKDKDDVKLTVDELKTAVKVTGGVFVTVVHEGENGSEIKVGGGFGGFGGKGGKGKDKKKDKDDK